MSPRELTVVIRRVLVNCRLKCSLKADVDMIVIRRVLVNGRLKCSLKADVDMITVFSGPCDTGT
jgi:hypothetical protein